ncbi:hypothetical protein [Nocardia nepalensis]|uniref:hypothetical protein n=1 Tax=Nocardia nepalensis TaxID=3375448 RepID=UPI003B67E64E
MSTPPNSATHTRCGVVTALLHRQLADFAARGEIVAGLRGHAGRDPQLDAAHRIHQLSDGPTKINVSFVGFL